MIVLILVDFRDDSPKVLEKLLEDYVNIKSISGIYPISDIYNLIPSHLNDTIDEYQLPGNTSLQILDKTIKTYFSHSCIFAPILRLYVPLRYKSYCETIARLHLNNYKFNIVAVDDGVEDDPKIKKKCLKEVSKFYDNSK